MELPMIPFMTAENVSTFWQFVGAILYVVIPLLLIWIATTYAGELIKVVRTALTTRQDRPADEEKRYDIKIKD